MIPIATLPYNNMLVSFFFTVVPFTSTEAWRNRKKRENKKAMKRDEDGKDGNEGNEGDEKR